MTEPNPEGKPAPGEVRPEATLDRSPAERYRTRTATTVPAPLDRFRAVAAGAVASAVVALVMGMLSAIFDVELGSLAVAAVGGWAIGIAVVWGAVGFGDGRRPASLGMLAATLGALTWLAASLVDYLVSLAILPGSTRPFGERIAAQPFIDYLGQQLSVVDALQIALLVIVAWRSAR